MAVPTFTFTEGSEKLNEYEQLRRIDGGSFGEVFLFMRKKDKEELVAKRVTLTSLTLQQQAEAEKEAWNLARLNHRNIVTFEDSFRAQSEHQECFFIIMEYCEGGNLRTCIVHQIDSLERFHLKQILHWFHPICCALDYVHRRKGMHRDLKPENIFQTASGTVKVGDFGISIITGTLNPAMRSTNAGTFPYMAPEVVNASEQKKYDHNCDLWSLGVILYELITLKKPFAAHGTLALAKEISAGKYDPLPTTTRPELPVSTHLELCTVATELLNVDASKRPSCLDILDRRFMSNFEKARELSRQQAEEDERKEPEVQREFERLSSDWFSSDENKNNKYTLLHYVCLKGASDAVIVALCLRGDIEAKCQLKMEWYSSENSTPLHVASFNGTLPPKVGQGHQTTKKDAVTKIRHGRN